jgi:hypothetical protein
MVQQEATTKRRWRMPAIAATTAAIAAVAGGVTQIGAGSKATAAPTPVKTGAFRVIRTDLSITQQVYGSITFANNYAIVNPTGSTSQTVNQAQQSETGAQNNLDAAKTALADSNSVNTQTVAESQTTESADQSAVSADQAQQASDLQKQTEDSLKQTADCAGKAKSSPACTADGQQLSQDGTKVSSDSQNLSRDTASLTNAQAVLSLTQAKTTQSSDQAQAAVTSANQALLNAENQMAAVSQNAVLSGDYTQLPVIGQQIQRGQTVYAVDSRPIPLFYGTVTPWRDLGLGISDGADVAQLEENLVELGFGAGLPVNTHFGPAAAEAVMRWQTSLGVAQTGRVTLGEVVFAPEALRVTNVHVAAGTAVQPGQTVLNATGTTPAVTVALSVDQEHLVHDGDSVQVDLPDGRTTVAGRVTHIDTVATAVPSSQPGTPSTNPTNNGPQATVNLTITLEHFATQESIDQEPVTVQLTDKRVKSVLAVPITALLALAGGGYGVKVQNGPTSEVIAVRTGLFANTLVEISGPGITTNTVVQLPAS